MDPDRDFFGRITVDVIENNKSNQRSKFYFSGFLFLKVNHYLQNFLSTNLSEFNPFHTLSFKAKYSQSIKKINMYEIVYKMY